MIDVDQQTDSNSDTALTLASAGGHDELVTLLLVKGADIEHRDKKGTVNFVLKYFQGSVPYSWDLNFQSHYSSRRTHYISTLLVA